MKKESKITIIKILCFGLIMCLSLIIANKVMLYKGGTDKFKDFYTEKEGFDVLFFGSSRVLDAFQPMELWEDYGIRSYNMAQHAESLARDYWQLKNALEHNSTRLVVMDISAYYGLYGIDPSIDEQRGGLHKQIDHMPLSLTKLNLIYDICPRGSRAEFIFPFILYHSRWNEMSTYDFTSYKYKNNRKGAEVRDAVVDLQRPSWDDSLAAETFPFENTKIKEIVDLCQKHNTELLFVCLPYCADEERMSMLKYISDYLDEESIDFINYMADADYIDFSKDFSDEVHLNAAGSLKITDHFGKYFVEHYGVNETDIKTQKEWNDVLADYKLNKDSKIEGAESYEQLLMLTYTDDDYDIKIYTSPERIIETGTSSYYPEAAGIEGIEGYKIEVYKKGQSQPLRIWECD